MVVREALFLSAGMHYKLGAPVLPALVSSLQAIVVALEIERRSRGWLKPEHQRITSGAGIAILYQAWWKGVIGQRDRRLVFF